MKKIYAIIITLSIILSNISQANAYNIDPFDFLSPYEKLLDKNLKENIEIKGIKTSLIDYRSWQLSPLHKVAIKKLKHADISQLKSTEEKLSFWINAYNLLAIDLIIQHKEKSSITNIGGLVADPWRKIKWDINGKNYSLYTIEYKQLRKLDRPRYHFALTCTTISCPDLKKTPYYKIKIYSQLEEQTKKFLENPTKGLRISKSEKEEGSDNIHLSTIFRKYKKDFGQGKVTEFLINYIDTLEKIVSNNYIEHNWGLNVQSGRWAK